MIEFSNKEVQMDDLLDRMAQAIQLDKTRYQRMIQHYEAVKDWIEKDENFFKPYKFEVYPHGSVRILTSIKPIESTEFDLDVVIHLKAKWNSFTPEKIYNELKRRLNENETYREMLEPKNRCLRLNYSGDFHMDILPGIQELELDENKLKVPDRELDDWVSSNPRGYANWFLYKANLIKESLLEKAIRAEKLPVDDFNMKKPLQRGVQLIKRYRDEFFKEDDTYKTSSIVLTTICGQFYNGEASIFETIDNIVTRIVLAVKSGGMQRIKVVNPVNEEEDFTDKWEKEPEYYNEFKRFAIHLHGQWQKLKNDQGVVAESIILKGLFGEDLFTRGQAGQALYVETLRKNSTLAVNRTNGSLTTAGAAAATSMIKNTFYGD